jgi:hypothetical protein
MDPLAAGQGGGAAGGPAGAGAACAAGAPRPAADVGPAAAALPQRAKAHSVAHVSRARRGVRAATAVAAAALAPCRPRRRGCAHAPCPPTPNPQLRARHRDNLVALLRASLARGAYGAAAGAAAALLGADTFAVDARELLGGAAGAKRTRRKAEVVWAVFELLRRHGASSEQVGGWVGRGGGAPSSAAAARGHAGRSALRGGWTQADDANPPSPLRVPSCAASCARRSTCWGRSPTTGTRRCASWWLRCGSRRAGAAGGGAGAEPARGGSRRCDGAGPGAAPLALTRPLVGCPPPRRRATSPRPMMCWPPAASPRRAPPPRPRGAPAAAAARRGASRPRRSQGCCGTGSGAHGWGRPGAGAF